MKYEVWVLTESGYQKLLFDTREEALYVIKQIRRVDDWNCMD